MATLPTARMRLGTVSPAATSANMPVIHFLNVKQGDCSVIEHGSGHVTVIDVCNGKPTGTILEEVLAKADLEQAAKGVFGNFNQKKYPVNPLAYLSDRKITDIFRFILTHPDMDHMDGIKALFERFRPINFYDTDNKEEKSFDSGSPFNVEDWKFYKKLRDSNPSERPKRLTLLSGEEGSHWNRNWDGTGGGDGLHILAPTQQLVLDACESGDYNDISYVLLYRVNVGAETNTIVFGGDSHDKTWEHILDKHKHVTNVDVLIAPHHGRKSDRDYTFLDVLRPKLTLFGNANSEHLAYGAWTSRKLAYITNNQAGSVIVNADVRPMEVYVTHKPYAQKVNTSTTYSAQFGGYYCGTL